MSRLLTYPVLPVATALAGVLSVCTAVALGRPALVVASTALGLLLFVLVVTYYRLWKTEVVEAHAALGSLSEYRVPNASSGKGRAKLVPRLLKAYEHFYDETARRNAALAERLARYEFMAMHTDDMVLQVDSQGVLKHASPSLKQQLGYAETEVVGRQVLDFLHPEDCEAWVSELERAAKARQSVLLEGRWLDADGRYVALEMSVRHAFGLNGHVLDTIAIARNVEARNALRYKLETAARTDALTGLLNRAALVDTLQSLKGSCARKPFGLFLFDLDRFKQVNDSLGHAAGDDYLVETTRRVSSVLRDKDVFARMGGDEFVALFTNVADEAALRSIANRVIEEVTKPYQCHGELLYPKTSIGMLLCDDPELPTDELISRADRAMYVAKNQGGNVAVLYDDSQADTLRKSFAVEQELTLALKEGRLALQLQPIVDAKSKQPVLAEALVRIRGTDGQLIGPGFFIEVAEKTGLIFQVGAWVLEQACLHARKLEEAGHAVSISVNVSPRQLMHLNYVRSVEEILERTGVSPSSLVLEVTESAVMQDVQRARATLTHLRSLGFKLALDDFGSGYSSISMLKNLPFDILKIDRAFVADAEASSIGPSTLAAIIDIGKSLNLTIIAEGIETEAQSLGLERLGCDLLQGFLFHRPLDPQIHRDLVLRSQGERLAGRNIKTATDDVVLFI